VAVCLAGDVRTFIHPRIWGSLTQLLHPPSASDDERLDLFLVLGTAADPPKQSYGLGRPTPPPHPKLLARALTAMRPTAVRLLPQPSGWSCKSRPTAQFSKWADCVELIQEHEAKTSGGAPMYEYLFKHRPDAYVLMS
jgi:hypothetical protein